VKKFVATLDYQFCSPVEKEFVSFNLDIAHNASDVVVAAVFFFGREKLIPLMFQQMLQTLEAHKIQCPKLEYYFRRHIELDGDEHGPRAQNIFDTLCAQNPDQVELAQMAALKALQLRHKLWDGILEQLSSKRDEITVWP